MICYFIVVITLKSFLIGIIYIYIYILTLNDVNISFLCIGHLYSDFKPVGSDLRGVLMLILERCHAL